MESKRDKDRPTILIVEDNEITRDTLEAILGRTYRVIKAEDGETALEIVKNTEVNLVLLDIMLPGIDGLEVLRIIKDQHEDIEVIIITVVKEVDTAVKAIKLGAYDYITKEFDYDLVLNLVARALEKQRDKRKLLYLRSEMKQLVQTDFVLGTSEKMKEIYSLVQTIAKIPATVLITGESGTGKELIARMIYQQMGDPSIPFVTVNLPSIPPDLVESTLFGHEKGAFTGATQQHIGKFELAHKGILFLDEIAELRYDLQAKLLRALQSGEIERIGGSKIICVDIRFIAATNRDLKEAVRGGTFREDLYFRLNVIPIHLPPLRERTEDIPALVDFFIRKYSHKFGKKIEGLASSALEVLTRYPWPGNIRELENLIERLVAVSRREVISIEDIPLEYYLSSFDTVSQDKGENLLKNACMAFERNFILKIMDKVKWNRKKGAEVLGIPLSTLKFRMKQLNIPMPLKGKFDPDEE
ncbi:MAG: sigma-54 dependent transcriptional regulator [bacterium]|nr:sigma-54 dependent transcriptional regulator [bacterium]